MKIRTKPLECAIAPNEAHTAATSGANSIPMTIVPKHAPISTPAGTAPRYFNSTGASNAPTIATPWKSDASAPAVAASVPVVSISIVGNQVDMP